MGTETVQTCLPCASATTSSSSSSRSRHPSGVHHVSRAPQPLCPTSTLTSTTPRRSISINQQILNHRLLRTSWSVNLSNHRHQANTILPSPQPSSSAAPDRPVYDTRWRNLTNAQERQTSPPEQRKRARRPIVAIYPPPPPPRSRSSRSRSARPVSHCQDYANCAVENVFSATECWYHCH